ncbi:EAL domain-containing protein [Dechloromonas sp. ZY10]|uniref:EAL domain-containing protein n=1 Tax=Dechloromonas aquae TaxID=2664436 RepID=UPI0035274AD9
MLLDASQQIDPESPVGPWSPLFTARMSSVFETIQEGIQFWDREGRLLFANTASLEQVANDELVAPGVHWLQWMQFCLSEQGAYCRPESFPVARALAGDPGVGNLLVRIIRKDDTHRWVRFNAHAMFDDATGEQVGAVSSTVDVTLLVEQERRLQHDAHYDALTGLPNRVLLADRMRQAIARARRSGEWLAVCLMDLDGFKAVNDTLGHAAGDQLLQEIARRLGDVLRIEDTAARLGGDEFALLLGGIKTSGACEQVLRRILEAVATPCRIGGHEARVSASIGVTLAPQDPSDADQLLRHADQAMYRAKQSGKNRFDIFDPMLESKARANQGLRRKIEQALERGDFCLYFQPKVDCRRGRVLGLEALIRWNHPVLGVRTPAEFLPLIEHDEMIVRLGEWVLDEALRQLQKLHAAGHPVSISVNISAYHFQHGQLEERLGELLGKYPEALLAFLEIEIVETAALEDVGQVVRLISRYHAGGLRFALDDFGTGYSSLVHLKHLPVDVLKIDQTFVRDMLGDPGDLAIVQGVIGLASAFRRQVVAEGVESIEHVLLLLALGCDIMQGYGIARPMPAERLYEWLDEFCPDPRWRVAGTGYPSHADFQLLLQETAHRHWFERLQAAASAGRTDALPCLEHAACRMSQWFADPRTRKQFAASQRFKALEVLHFEVHRLAGQWAAAPMTDGGWAALIAAHGDFMRLLAQFRQAQVRRHAKQQKSVVSGGGK